MRPTLIKGMLRTDGFDPAELDRILREPEFVKLFQKPPRAWVVKLIAAILGWHAISIFLGTSILLPFLGINRLPSVVLSTGLAALLFIIAYGLWNFTSWGFYAAMAWFGLSAGLQSYDLILRGDMSALIWLPISVFVLFYLYSRRARFFAQE